jgi:excisionase family DNA binding protein
MVRRPYSGVRTPSRSEEADSAGDAARRPPLQAHDILKVADAAQLLGLPVSTVYDYAKRGILPSRKLGRRVIFLRPELESWLWDQAA